MDEDFEGLEREAEQFTATYLELEVLQRRTQLSANVLLDLQKKGPIFNLVMAKRKLALEALDNLLAADPRDTAEVAAQQARVLAYFEDCRWIHAILEDGRQADSEIMETYGVRDGGQNERA